MYRVKSITEHGTDGTQGNSLTITYGNNLTKFIDEQGYSNTYTFDNYGHCITIADFGKESENIDNAYGQTYEYGTSGGKNNKLTLESKMISVKELSNNLVTNSKFDDGLTGWTKHANCTDSDTVVSLDGNNVFKITGNPSNNKYLKQTINTSGEAGDIYTIYAWVKSLGVPSVPGNVKSSRVTIGVTQTDGEVQWSSKIAVSGTDGWQFISNQFITKKAYTQIDIYLIFYGNANEIYFDNIGLFKEEFGTSYQYDDKGNVISTQNLAKENSTFNYDSNNNLIQSINPKGGKFTYEYDQNIKNRLLSATNSSNVKYSFGYDNYGNTTTAKINNTSNANKYIESKSTYSSNGNYTVKTENQVGKETTYTYNESKGTVNSITDPNGNTTNYTYDNLDRLTNTSVTNGSNVHQNSYTYENDNLKTVNHNGFNYSFEYDTFGNQKQVKVGNQALITNTYKNNNGNIRKSSYGNGQDVEYGYDRFNRISSQVGENGSYFYTYDGRGNLNGVENTYTTTNKILKYDLADRLVEQRKNNVNFIQSYKYDKNNNISQIESRLVKNMRLMYNVYYNYDNDNIINSISACGYDIFYEKDELQRINKKKITKDNVEYNIQYSYTDLSNGRTTTQVKSLKNGNNDELNYTYDNNGNIKTISKGNELKQTYYYDSLGQLIRENDKEQNKTITYSYDIGGNILNKKEYEYTTTDTLQEPLSTITYSYENTNWKDQLTKYNNKAITYDTIGNPLTYDGNTYTWQNGRTLASVTNATNNINVQYKYDENGIREEKIIGDTVTYYSVNGSKVVFQKTNNEVLYFDYDENGQVITVQYYNNSTNEYESYIYIKNLQGDIIEILDEQFNLVAKYNYDSWGNVLSVTDANGTQITDQNHIGNMNPFRYRGYYYDTETGLYYLQNRYYNPEWGRFLNADGILNDTTLGKNLYAYCDNNPINNADINGNLTITSLFSVLIGTVIIVNLLQFASKVDFSALADMITPSSNSKTKSEPLGTMVALSSPSANGEKPDDSKYEKKLNNKTKNSKKISSKTGYNSFGSLKKAVGSPGTGKEWHHIVEQCQIKKSGIDVQVIQNKDNIISVSKGIHRKISGYYSSKSRISEGLSIREWLSGKDYKFQYKFGIETLKEFGVL